MLRRPPSRRIKVHATDTSRTTGARPGPHRVPGRCPPRPWERPLRGSGEQLHSPRGTLLCRWCIFSDSFLASARTQAASTLWNIIQHLTAVFAPAHPASAAGNTHSAPRLWRAPSLRVFAFFGIPSPSPGLEDAPGGSRGPLSQPWDRPLFRALGSSTAERTVLGTKTWAPRAPSLWTLVASRTRRACASLAHTHTRHASVPPGSTFQCTRVLTDAQRHLLSTVAPPRAPSPAPQH